jgi:TRAP-type C4-dicarboxylate transport system substrate-binding protein
VPRSLRACLALCAPLLAIAVLHAQAPVKIGTIAPDGSIWTKAMREMGEAWTKRTNGRVRYNLYPGTVGTEEAILRDMRISRRLHAAQLSAVTLANLDDAFNVFGIPMFYESYEEVDAVLEKLSPVLDQRLQGKGLKVLNWGYVGWVHIFSKTPVTSVDDLRRLKLYTSAGDDRYPKWYRDNGFNPVPLDASQMMSALSTGMVQAVPVTPLSAQIFAWYRSAPFMMDVGFAPLIGATVMSVDAWKKIGADDQKMIIEEAEKAGRRLRTDIPRLDKEAIAEMSRSGLKVTSGSQAEWRKAVEQFSTAMRGTIVPAPIYDAARETRDAVRAARGKKG